MSVSLEQFVHHLTESGLMSAAEVSSFSQALPTDHHPTDAEALARQLVEAKKLTQYQAQAVSRGEATALVFDEYVVLDKIGQGGMGVVLKAQHRRMKRLVAVKILPPAAMKTPQAVQRFYREVEAAAKLNHPNIVQAYDAREYQGSHCLVMEYVDGKDLSAVVKERGSLPIAQAVDFILQAARGLQYAHKRGIVHRDIKPGNLLLDKDGTVKILDMGLARIAGLVEEGDDADRLTASGQVMGTCDYMAPEQAMDTHHVDARADIYSLGCTMYRLLVGEAMYKGETLAKILISHQMASIPSLSQVRRDVPPQLDAVFQKMVAKKPEDRQQTMAAVIADLEAYRGLVQDGANDATAIWQAGGGPQSVAIVHQGETIAVGTQQAAAPVRDETLSHHSSAEPTTRFMVRLVRGMGKRKLLAIGIAVAVAILVGVIVLKTVQPGGHGLDDNSQESQPLTTTTAEVWPPTSPVLRPGAPPPAVAPFDAKKAKKHQEAWAKFLGLPVEMTNSIGMELRKS